MRPPRLLMRLCALPSCKFAASRLNIKRHYAQLQQWAFDVHPIAKCVAAAARLPDTFDLTATTSLSLRQLRNIQHPA